MELQPANVLHFAADSLCAAVKTSVALGVLLGPQKWVQQWPRDFQISRAIQYDSARFTILENPGDQLRPEFRPIYNGLQ